MYYCNTLNMDKKVCFKCGVEKAINDFYKHPQMSDGHLNKCKECTKNDVSNNYLVKTKNSEYVEKERARNREKYIRLGYINKFKRAHIENSNTSRYLKSIGVLTKGFEAHHWNYNLKNDVIIMDKRSHSRIHKHIMFDKDTNMFRTKSDGVLLDTKDKHMEFISQYLSEGSIYKILLRA